jgi:hypothetical protein
MVQSLWQKPSFIYIRRTGVIFNEAALVVTSALGLPNALF